MQMFNQDEFMAKVANGKIIHKQLVLFCEQSESSPLSGTFLREINKDSVTLCDY